jgi:hypothetical protein
VSPFRPFRHRAFATVWAGSFVSNIGTGIETAVLSGTGTVCQLRAPRELRARIASLFMLGVVVVRRFLFGGFLPDARGQQGSRS